MMNHERKNRLKIKVNVLWWVVLSFQYVNQFRGTFYVKEISLSNQENVCMREREGKTRKAGRCSPLSSAPQKSITNAKTC